MRDRRRTTRHITECVRILLDLLDTKVCRSTFIQFLQETTHLQVYFPEYQAFFDVAGQTLTDFAVRLLHKEMKRFHAKEDHLKVRNWGDDSYTVTNDLHGKAYDVMLTSDGRCECTFNCTLAVGCSHIFAVRQTLATTGGLFDRSDYHRRWLRNSSESKDVFPVYREFMDRTLDE
ncbi:hypothetical protein RvY_16343 [Ramazzottius varieornatus]|uniref:SWIM-type domain-containing protein n=1 Tax=Ramazzottius varieornatus TaxID=947166 RepID=A0A1D1VY56_RAMVA|nr:hypothetical protein RvY_16342 [Ramazzottius varieornatus]GAV06333.1 hypothetical protein RvY_16343 [Ramazzottius varieornatus]